MAKELTVQSKAHGTHIVLLDDEDYKKIQENNIKVWINYAPTVHNFYAIFWNNNKRVRLHRWITNCPADKMVDHINHNTLDNRKENLRITTHFGNMQNRRDNKVGKTGVYYSKRDKVYVARYKTKWLGQSKNKQEAIRLREQEEKIQKDKG